MRVLVCGSRTWENYSAVYNRLAALPPGTVIVHGHCPRGADAHADRAATELGLPVERYPADWDRYGKSAGHRRNAEMLDTVSPTNGYVIAFQRDGSPGTQNTIDGAASRDLYVEVHEWPS